MWLPLQNIRGLWEMNNLTQNFTKGNAIIPFIVGGFPDMEATKKLIFALEAGGADAIIIGIPFSDPVAEHPLREAAYIEIMEKAYKIDTLFQMLEEIRPQTKLPLLLMTYYNPIFSRGNEAFVTRCKQVGIGGLIVADLPFIHREELNIFCKGADIDLITVLADNMGDNVSQMAKESTGFLYCMDALTSHGKLPLPSILVCRDSKVADIQKTAKQGAGVILDSAILELLANGNSLEEITSFIQQIKA